MSILDWLYPKRCCGCGRWGSYLCPQCVKKITQQELICPCCERNSIGGVTHPLCKRKFGLDGLWSLGDYRGPLKEAIKQLKYRFVSDIAQVLVDLIVIYWAMYTPRLIEEIKKDRGKNWLVVPVPLHPKRKNWRGFNQSAQMGKLLAEKLELEYGEALSRIIYTKPQVQLRGWERKRNLNNTFVLSKNWQIKDKNIVLLDDVWTTGSTLKECCYVLKRNGAAKVWGMTLAS